jgi:hypothetical protein
VDNKWRKVYCHCDAGTEHRLTLGGYYEYTCESCKGSGNIWIRPSDHCFSYPGGPALGCWPGKYQEAEPIHESAKS